MAHNPAVKLMWEHYNTSGATEILNVTKSTLCFLLLSWTVHKREGAGSSRLLHWSGGKKENNDSVSLTSPNRRHVPRLWMTSSARSEWSESHTRPMLMISGQFIRTRRIRNISPQLLWNNEREKEGILSTCACMCMRERKGEGEMKGTLQTGQHGPAGPYVQHPMF